MQHFINRCLHCIKVTDLYSNYTFIKNAFPYLWLTLFVSKISGTKSTSVVQSSSGTHPPLALVHSRRRGALHLHTDVSHFLRVKRPYHHHVYVAKLISPDVLQTNPRRPRLCAWKPNGKVLSQCDRCVSQTADINTVWFQLCFLSVWIRINNKPVFCILQVFVKGVSGGTDSPSPIVTSRTNDMQGALMLGLSKS